MSQQSPLPPPHTCKDIIPIEKDIQFDDCIFRSYQWNASKDNWKGRVLFIHGYRDHHSVYNQAAEYIAKDGFDFFFFYQRGEGESKLVNNSKGVSDDYYAYKAIDDMIDYNINEMKNLNLPTENLHLMGLSMGGGLILNYACHGKYKNLIKSYLAIAPLITLHKDSDPGLAIEYIVRTICCFNFGKNLRVNSPLNLEFITGDLEYQKFMKSVGDTSALKGAFVETRDFILRGRKLLDVKTYSTIVKETPLLICHGECDRITNIESSKKFISLINSIDGVKNKQIITYSEGRHQLLGDIPQVRELVISDIIVFLNKNK
ncbi:hypothetical protein C6P40_003188 [Pichia californica]|uniref:Serine aminopeptidase S33 domain-containing protein n=1 Tax=Pichia californica TaxID=460514 RepID=A0A9P7BER0_9ASCO|nr:hypothetical protein C6P42_002959 [[Candida] californica]KAG0686914.1 hypothetical protein C6P40_003188 [[Candida] californica]